jgi:hypothetical protein
MMDTRAVWQYEPVMSSWSLHLVRGQPGSSLGTQVAFRDVDGTIGWADHEPAQRYDGPPLLVLPAWILTDVVLPAAPGAPNARQQAGRVDALEQALEVERRRVDTVLEALLEQK